MTKLNEQIKALCDARGYDFKPWEILPWDVDAGECPYPPSTAAAA
jgi:hypothetical protein